MESEWTWVFEKRANKQFQKLDKVTKVRIIAWLDKNILSCADPRLKGEALSGELGEFWKYRIGKYRLIADIKDEEFIVLIMKVAKRSEAYNR